MKNITLLEESDIVRTDPALVMVLDDALSEDLKSRMRSLDYDFFSWPVRRSDTRRHNVIPGKSETRHPILEEIHSSIIHRLSSANPLIQRDGAAAEFLIKSLADGKIPQGLHRDSNIAGPVWTFLIHMKGSNGATCFVDSIVDQTVVSRVEFKQGRVIVFPSAYHHFGELPVSDDRYVYTIIQTLRNFSASSSILRLTPALQEKYHSSFNPDVAQWPSA